jgi:threonine dehydratase
MECLQTTGAFKLRGASNFIAKLIENDKKPKRIVANSSGNHAQAVAYAAKQFNIPVTIFSTKNISTVKAAATRYYGASLKLFDTRPEADKAVKVASQEEGSVWIPPFNHPDIIAGQGTAAYEALQEIKNPDAIFAPCGGGGLVSGTLISARALSEHTKVIGVEPLQANDAAQSLRKGHIVSLTQTPATLADGAATPSVGEHTFRFLQELDDFVEVNEHDIAYWTQWLQHLLKMHIEPTCAMPMQAVFEYLKAYKESGNDAKQTVVVIISGGNISAQSMQKVWSHDHLDKVPQL